MEKKYLQFEIKTVKGSDELTIVASDETLDRYGEVVPLDAWDLKNYKNNPVLLVDHDYKIANIVGRAKNLKVTKDAMTFTPEFHGITDLAKQVSEMVKAGFAPAVSVGFLPHGPEKDGDTGHNELLEISFVAVGANPNALALAMKAFKPEQEAEIKTWLGEGTEEIVTDKEKQTVTMSQQLFDVMEAQVKEAQVIVKEGRVLSGKNRELINNCSTALKAAVSLLDDLLNASEPNKGKEDAEHKGRDPKVEQGPSAPKKAPSSVVRVLQDINKSSNALLKELKADAQS